MMKQCAIFCSVTTAAVTPALAHSGDHSGMSLVEVIGHYAEADHLFFLALSVLVGVLAFRAGRRFEAKARASAKRREEP